MTVVIITLPRELVSRAGVRHIVPNRGDTDIVIDAGETERVSPAAADSLMQALLNAAPERVVVVNATAAIERTFRLVHRSRATPERSFLMTFRDVPAEALLRPV